MNEIALEYYHNRYGLLSNSSDLWENHNTFRIGPNIQRNLTHEDVKRNENFFYEFLIDGKPLSIILDKHFKNKTPVTFNWISPLGRISRAYEYIFIKQLLNQAIEKEGLPKIFDYDSTYLDSCLREINLDSRVLIYRCHCMEQFCGGYFMTIQETEKTIVWKFDKYSHEFYNHRKEIMTKNKYVSDLKFEFDKKVYYSLFNKYLEKRVLKK